MAISSLGVGSGLDLSTLVDNLLRVERAPAEARLDRNQSRAQLQLSALGTLKSAVSGLANAADALKGWQTKLEASSSAPETVAAAVNGLPVQGRYLVQVQELAAAQSLASAAFDDVDGALGEGTVTVSVGDTSFEIELAEGANSLASVRDAINAADAGIQAVIVRDGGQHRLLLTSAETGLAHQMTLTVDGTVDARLASAQMTETRAARDAVFRINGLELTASGNVVDDVVPGVTLTLMKRTEGDEEVAVSIAQDRAEVRSKLEAMVSAYNTLVGRLRDLGRHSPDAAQRGPLVGDATLRSIQSRLGGVFSAVVESGFEGSPFSRLLDIGIHTNADGRATLNAERLSEAMVENEGALDALVAGFAETLHTTLDAYGGSGGVLDARTSGLNAELRRIAEQREALDRRMEQVEARLRAQFTALDTLVAQFQSTSNFLADQLAGLRNMTAGSGDSSR